ncbi:hypothetical protein G7047_11555 [Diaphorobacter sp. HDW4A]|uniref:CZB domain-containing protein n=1 Tax=Diaphorobacter sp. HDW4A TaxID=2714924 RepID=UPI00140B4DFE|nr:CZB domain-containing protein [Diaphorobacter sp. HDW4A]QIL80467.1 hypothetical protein G7047_11555 [Diaphorobacter sp. HDW4A]
MGLFQWLNKGPQGDELPNPSARDASRAPGASGSVVVPLPVSASRSKQTNDAPDAGGLDFASAIRVHREWKVRLHKYISNESLEKLDATRICRDDQCALGKWINGSGAGEFGHLPSFGGLKVAHGQFHLAAGRIVQLHDDQHTDEAAQMLRHGDYSRHSIKVMGLLSALYIEVSDTLHGDGV